MFNLLVTEFALNEIPKMPEYKLTGNAGLDSIVQLIWFGIFATLIFFIYKKAWVKKTPSCIPPKTCPHVDKLNIEFQNKINLQKQEMDFF